MSHSEFFQKQANKFSFPEYADFQSKTEGIQKLWYKMNDSLMNSFGNSYSTYSNLQSEKLKDILKTIQDLGHDQLRTEKKFENESYLIFQNFLKIQEYHDEIIKLKKNEKEAHESAKKATASVVKAQNELNKAQKENNAQKIAKFDTLLNEMKVKEATEYDRAGLLSKELVEENKNYQVKIAALFSETLKAFADESLRHSNDLDELSTSFIQIASTFEEDEDFSIKELKDELQLLETQSQT